MYIKLIIVEYPDAEIAEIDKYWR